VEIGNLATKDEQVLPKCCQVDRIAKAAPARSL
jgi:hypothetical protein